jgi:hypothetical protein
MGATKDATKGDVFPKHNGGLVGAHGNRHGVIDGAKQIHAFRFHDSGGR